VHTVNLYPVLQKEKKNDRTGDLLYLNTDTHWTPRGARIAAKAIAEQVKKMEVSKELPKLALKDSIVTAVRTGDIATMADLEYAFPNQTVEAHQVKDAKTGAPLRSDFRKSKILILGDSYSRIYETDAPMSAGWISQFANEMQTPVASIVSDGGASTLVREKLARRSGALKNKKLVIWEFVERDLRFGAEGWKIVRFD
jgi:lysophospholipase L1-like esterase